MPGMNTDLEVEVLRGVSGNDPSEGQGDDLEEVTEMSGVEMIIRRDAVDPGKVPLSAL
jgi:hypothetical protein